MYKISWISFVVLMLPGERVRLPRYLRAIADPSFDIEFLHLSSLVFLTRVLFSANDIMRTFLVLFWTISYQSGFELDFYWTLASTLNSFFSYIVFYAIWSGYLLIMSAISSWFIFPILHFDMFCLVHWNAIHLLFNLMYNMPM